MNYLEQLHQLMVRVNVLIDDLEGMHQLSLPDQRHRDRLLQAAITLAEDITQKALQVTNEDQSPVTRQEDGRQEAQP